jgi:hypothetical protein
MGEPSPFHRRYLELCGSREFETHFFTILFLLGYEPIVDIVSAFADGVTLSHFVEALTGVQFKVWLCWKDILF